MAQTNIKILLGIQLTLFLLIAAGILFYFHAGMQPDSLIGFTCLATLVLFIWSILSWRLLSKSFFDPYILFLIALALFSSGQTILEVFHLNQDGLLKDKFASDLLLSTLILVLLSVAAFHFGALVSLATRRNDSLEGSSEPVSSQAIRWVGWGLLGISFFPAIYVFRSAIDTVAAAGYFALYQQDASTGLNATPQILATFLVPSALFLLASSRRRIEVVSSLLIILSYTAIQLFLGARSKAVMPLVAYFWLWHWCIRPLPKTLLFGAASFMLFLVFPLIRVVRAVSGSERVSLEFLVESFFSIDNPVVSIMTELGETMSTIAYTIDLVPLQRSFDGGASYLYALLTALPNIFGTELHPTLARGFAATWLTETINPTQAKLGGSLGFSMIAEAYLNFGWLGSPILMGIMGFLFVRLILWGGKPWEPAKMATLASFLSFVLFLPRSESAAMIRPLIWYSIFPFIIVSFLSLRYLRSSRVST